MPQAPFQAPIPFYLYQLHPLSRSQGLKEHTPIVAFSTSWSPFSSQYLRLRVFQLIPQGHNENQYNIIYVNCLKIFHA
jgi:hypothetical protein